MNETEFGAQGSAFKVQGPFSVRRHTTVHPEPRAQNPEPRTNFEP